MAGHPTYHVNVIKLRVCLHVVGGPQVGEVTWGGSAHLSCKRDQIKGLFTSSWGTPDR